MPDLHVLIAAAGKGRRSGLPYPKTLHPIFEKPILLRLIELLEDYDSSPTIVVSPEGEPLINNCLHENNKSAHIVIQDFPLGMGNAVLKFRDSPIANKAENIVLVWGDVPFLKRETVAQVVDTHWKNGNSFTFASRYVDSAYTIISRDEFGQVIEVIETRENGLKPSSGERDIGLFVFNQKCVMEALEEELPNKYGQLTSGHGFLYIIKHLVSRGFRVEALPIAKEQELISLNKLSDLNLPLGDSILML